ncbi:MAG: carboxypeptidase-like regulatory domain-containing protein [Pyrinomonadaceae bacterium]
MMKKENRMFMLLSIAVMMFLSLATTQVQAQTFSGQAIGVLSTTTTTTQVGAGTPTVTAGATVRLADTTPLPPRGGSLSAGVLTASVNLGTAPVTGTLNTGVIQTMTSGGNGTSQSQARVAGLNLLVGTSLGTNTITADAITTNTMCVCGAAGATCTGTTDIANLVVRSSTGAVLATFDGRVTASGATLFTATATSPNQKTTTTITIIANEQTRTNDNGDTTTDNITVNGLRVIVTETTTSTMAGITTTTTTTSDTIIAQAHSDIDCDAVIGPTAASATISGRVLTSKGRGLPGATVVLTNQNGEVKYAVTNPRGYYRFADIEVGEDYFLSVKSKRYVFATQSISFTEELADIDFMPTQ